MHELTIALRIVESLNEELAHEDDLTVSGVTIQIGALTGLVPEALQFSWDMGPGFILAEAVATLYQQLKANPAQYPKGMTVRILLGNPPELFHFELGNQVWHVIRDLREAGVPEIVLNLRRPERQLEKLCAILFIFGDFRCN